MRDFLRIALLAAILPAASGCHSLRLNQGRITSVFAAAQVGAFKREKGSWPTGIGDLVAHECSALDQDQEFVIDAPSPRDGKCQFFARLPYQLVLHPRASDMQVEMRSATGKLVCRLVIVLPADSAHALMPQVKLRTTLLTCPGEGKPW
jgi:hypothetical protein